MKKTHIEAKQIQNLIYIKEKQIQCMWLILTNKSFSEHRSMVRHSNIVQLLRKNVIPKNSFLCKAVFKIKCCTSMPLWKPSSSGPVGITLSHHTQKTLIETINKSFCNSIFQFSEKEMEQLIKRVELWKL